MHCIPCPPYVSWIDFFKLSHIIFYYTSTRHVLQCMRRSCDLSQKMHPVGSQTRFYHTIQAVFQKHTQAQNALLSDFGHKLNCLSRQRLVRLVAVQTLRCVRSHGRTWVSAAQSLSNNQNLKNKSCLNGEHEAWFVRFWIIPKKTELDWKRLKIMPGLTSQGESNGFRRTCTWFLFALSESIYWFLVFCVFSWGRE